MRRQSPHVAGRLRRAGGAVVCTLLATSALVFLSSGTAGAIPPTQLYRENFQDKTVTSPISKPNLSGQTNNNNNFACLTASADSSQTPVKGCALTGTDSGQGTLNSAGSGALRLTNNTGNRVGGSFYSTSLSTTASSGLDLAFNVYEYRSNTTFPADGTSFSLAAVDPAQQQAPTSLGPAGGNLGYNGQGTASPPGNGMAHGYLGIGFDTFGNYSNSNFNNGACTSDPSWATPAGGSRRFPQAVTVRGPGHLQSGYCMLNSSLNPTNVNDPGGNATVNSGLPTSRYSDGVTNGTTTLTSATASFTSADVGAPLFETDAQGVITDQTTITAVTNATTVTLSQTALTATNVNFYVSRTRIYSPATTRGAGTAVEIAINPTGSATSTTGSVGLSVVAVPALSYVVTYKPVLPAGAAQQTLVGLLPTSTNLLIPAGAIPASWINPATGIPYQLSFGWTGSTGSNNQINEISQTSVDSLGGAPPVLTLTANDLGAGNFNGNFSGDNPNNITSGTIFYDGGVDPDGAAETLPVSLLMRTSPGLQITGSATGTGWTCPATSVAADYIDGVANGTTTFTSATAAFNARDVGKAVTALDGQGALTAGTTIVSVNSATSVTLNQSAAAATSIAFGVGALSQYSDGVSTSASTTFTSATASFIAADVGALLVETDGQGAVVSQTTISARNSATSVTLSKASAVSATAIAFEVLRKSPSREWSASCTHAAPGAPGSSLPTLGLPVMIATAANILAPVASGFISSNDGTAAYAADPGLGTNPYRNIPTPVYTGPFPQGGPDTGLVGNQHFNSNLNGATIRGGNLDALTSLTWGSQTLSGPCPGTPVTSCFTINTGANASTGTVSVTYASQTLAGSATPSITLTNANGSTASGRPFTYYPPPTLVTVRGSANQNMTDGSEPAIITAPVGTNLSGTTTVWWGDGGITTLFDCGATTPRWNCFVVNSATQITAYPPGEVDVNASTDYRTALVGPPAQAAHTANVSLETNIGGATVDFEDFGNYTYSDVIPTAVGSGTGPIAGGTTVTITGTNLSSTTAVRFDGAPLTVCTGAVAAGCYVIDSATQIRAGSPAHAVGSVPIAVTAEGLTITAGTFTYTDPPTPPTPTPTTTTAPSWTSDPPRTTPTTTAPEPREPLRIAGIDRTETAELVSRIAFPEGAETVYIATSRDYADALSAGPGAVSETAPVLLTEVHTLNPNTASELLRLQPQRIVVMGGWAAVDDAVFEQLHTFATREVVRIAGVDRFGTAAMLSADKYPDGASIVYIATGRSYPDALAGGFAASTADGSPVLLTEPNVLPSVTAEELIRLSPDHIEIVGGTGAVSRGLEVLLADYAPDVERVAGDDRYATTAAVNHAAVDGTDTVFAVTGKSFGDALTGIPIAALTGSAMLMVGDGPLHASVIAELRRLQPKTVIVLGGTAAVAQHAEDQLAEFMGDGTGDGKRGLQITQEDVTAAAAAAAT